MKSALGNSQGLRESEDEYRKKFVERIIKSNRDVFIMISLLRNQMCGYDIIKDVFSKCDVFLSQGTVYPILYTLEEEGLIYAEYSKGDMRAKKYSLTAQGREVAEKIIEDFSEALEHISALLKE
jgi:PadR family transcriptional regulator PadR